MRVRFLGRLETQVLSIPSYSSSILVRKPELHNGHFLPWCISLIFIPFCQGPVCFKRDPTFPGRDEKLSGFLKTQHNFHKEMAKDIITLCKEKRVCSEKQLKVCLGYCLADSRASKRGVQKDWILIKSCIPFTVVLEVDKKFQSNKFLPFLSRFAM